MQRALVMEVLGLGHGALRPGFASQLPCLKSHVTMGKLSNFSVVPVFSFIKQRITLHRDGEEYRVWVYKGSGMERILKREKALWEGSFVSFNTPPVIVPWIQHRAMGRDGGTSQSCCLGDKSKNKIPTTQNLARTMKASPNRARGRRGLSWLRNLENFFHKMEFGSSFQEWVGL